ncbi:putative pre-mRNA branch site protein p14 [Parachaetomium inaequale]|uniref:Pre-mRNA branch site protein p14 n=1 Tax=Parachaetomium inaequale TaxID=2588326 RepID=A0AAN6PE73_9PEZI|nr:putative pre-mRNA branch site protein p14 [Parachaetomium inaequale]
MDRALFVKNLSYNVTPEELFDLFGKYGPIRQVRQGIASNTKGTAFVVYEDVMDAKQACDKLNGYNFQNRYLVDGPADSLPSQRNLSGGPSSPTSPSATTKAASAPRAPKSIVKKGKVDIATHARRMPHFVRKLLPTVPECA